MATTGLLSVLEEATTKSLSGELVVQIGLEVGRIFLVEGRIAWALSPNGGEHLGHMLDRDGVVDSADYARIIAECKVSGANVCEAMISAGLVGREAMRHHLRLYIAGHLSRLVEASNAPVVFMPQKRKYASELTFTFDELERLMRAAEVTESSTVLTGDEALASLGALDGLLGAAIIDASNGTVVHAIGTDRSNVEHTAVFETEAFEAELSLARALGLGDTLESTVVTTASHYNITQVLASHPTHFVVCLLATSANLAMALLRSSELAQSTRLTVRRPAIQRAKELKSR